MNNVKVFVLMAGLTSLFVAIGGYFGGQSGMIMAFVFAGLMNFVMYFSSATMVLKMYRARTVTAADAPDPVPACQESPEHGRLDRFDLLPQPGRLPRRRRAATRSGWLRCMAWPASATSSPRRSFR